MRRTKTRFLKTQMNLRSHLLDHLVLRKIKVLTRVQNVICQSLTAQTIVHPDTQVQTSVTNKPEFLKEFRGDQIILLGIGGSGIPVQVAELSFILQDEIKKPFKLETLRVYAQQASAVVLSHHGLRKAGFKVDYDEVRILTPDQDSVWTVPVSGQSTSSTTKFYSYQT